MPVYQTSRRESPRAAPTGWSAQQTRPQAGSCGLPVVLALLLAPATVEAAAAPTGLHVAGNQLLDGAGRPLLLHGVNRAGNEYACIQARGALAFDTASFDTSLYSRLEWNVNTHGQASTEFSVLLTDTTAGQDVVEVILNQA